MVDLTVYARLELDNQSYNARLKESDRLTSGFGRTSEQAGDDIAAYGEELDRLRAVYSPLYAAEKQRQETLDGISKAQRVGAINEEEAATAINLTEQAYVRQVGQIERVTKAKSGLRTNTKLTAREMQLLSFQLNDVAVSLAGGLNPLMVFAQQGSQITQIFGGARQTLAAFFRALTPGRLALGGITIGVTAAVAALLSYDRSARNLRTTATGLGRDLGVTGDILYSLAEDHAAAAQISQRQARLLVTELARTGTIQTEIYEELIGLSKDFAVTIGADYKTAAAQLAELFDDPGAGAKKLFEEYRLLDGATARYVQQLAEQNRAEEARQVLVEALPAKLASAERSVNELAGAFEAAMRSASDLYDSAGNELAGLPVPTREDVTGLGLGPTYARRLARELKTDDQIVERELDAAFEAFTARIDAYVAARDRDISKAVAAADAAGVNRASLRQRELAGEIARLQAGQGFALGQSASPEEEERITRAIEAKTRALETYRPEAEKVLQLARLDVQLAGEINPLRRAELAARREAIALAGEEISAAEASARIAAARLQVLGELTGAAKANIAVLDEEAGALELLNRQRRALGLSQGDAALVARQEAETRELTRAAMAAEGAERARLVDLINAQRDAIARLSEAETARIALDMAETQREQLALLLAEAAALDVSEEAARRAADAKRLEQELTRAGIDLHSAEAAAIREAAAARGELIETMNRERAVRDIARSQKEELEQLQLELELVGKTEAERRKAIDALRLEQELRRAGIDLNSEEAEALRAQRDEISELTAVLDKQREAYERWQSIGEDAIDGLTGMLDDYKVSWEELGDLVRSVIDDIIQEMLRLYITNPLKNALFGTDYQTGGGGNGLAGLGSFIAGLFGGSGSTSFADPSIFGGGGGNPWITYYGGGGSAPSGISGGFDLGLKGGSSAEMSGLSVVVNNNAPGVSVKTGEGKTVGGGRLLELEIDELQAGALSRPGSASGRALQQQYGARAALIQR